MKQINMIFNIMKKRIYLYILNITKANILCGLTTEV